MLQSCTTSLYVDIFKLYSQIDLKYTFKLKNILKENRICELWNERLHGMWMMAYKYFNKEVRPVFSEVQGWGNWHYISSNHSPTYIESFSWSHSKCVFHVTLLSWSWFKVSFSMIYNYGIFIFPVRGFMSKLQFYIQCIPLAIKFTYLKI